MQVAAGDYVIRADQPYRTLVDMYFALQNYPAANPLPYDDTGWTMPLLRNVDREGDQGQELPGDNSDADQGEALCSGRDFSGSGDTLVIENNTDNVLTGFRFAHPDVKMEAAEDDFDVDGHHLRAGAFILQGWLERCGSQIDCGPGSDRVCDLGPDGEDPCR